MSRNHLRVSAQANNERHESNIVRDLMNKATNDYAQSEATTITAAPPKVRLTKDVRMEAEISDLTKQVHDLMDDKDTQIEALSRQRESIATLREEVANLKGERNLNLSLNSSLQAKANAEIMALRTLLKLYI